MNHKFLRSVSLAWLLAAGLAVSSKAESTNLYAGGTWRLLDLAPVLKAAACITPAEYPDSDSATVDARSVRVYHPDGTAEAQDENFVKVLTEKGRRDNRTLELGFQLPYNGVEVVRLEAIKPDGSVVPVDVAANSKEAIDDSQMSMNIYDPNSRVLRVNIPRLEIGDVVHSVVRSTTLRPIIPGAYTEVMLFEGPGYIRHQVYEVHAPAARPLQCIRLRDEIKGTVAYSKKSSAGNVVHTWEVSNVPRMFDEPSMPPYERVLQRLLVSTLPNWPAVSKWYWELSEAHLAAVTPGLKDEVAKLTAGQTNDLDKVQALFFYVSKNIRYMGLTPEKDRPGFEPHDVCLTFDNKYGVCRDKAALLVAMLRTAGLQAFPVLINVGTKRDAEVPDPGFNHAIAAVELGKGNYVLMDPTDENTRDLLPDYDRDQSFLVCRPEGEKLRTSAIRPPEDNLMRVKTAGTLDAAGTLTAVTELHFDGVNDNAYRNALVKMRPDDQRRFFERNLKAALPGAKLSALKVTPENMLDMAAPLAVEMKFTADGMIAAGQGRAVVSLPWVGKNFGMVNFILNGTGLDRRKYPLLTEVACGLSEEVSLKLGDAFTAAVSMPVCAPVENATMSYREQVAFTNRTLTATRELKLKAVEFSPEEYLKLKKALEVLQYDGRKSPVFEIAGTAAAATAGGDQPLPPVDSNAEILWVKKTLAVQDAHAAVYTVKYAKRILTYLGKKREAEVKVEFNPACQSVRLLRGTVISASGQRREIFNGEINVMDAGWNASAKRYTGGKILVANLPGVEIGSTIEVEFEVTAKDRPFLSGYESFEMPDVLDRKNFELIAPAGLAVHSHVSGAPGTVQAVRTETNGLQLLQWSAEKVPALPAEMQLPPEWVYSAGVGYFVGEAPSYWKMLDLVLRDRAAKGTNAAALARQLTASAKTKLAAARAVRDYVVKSVRLAGPVFTELPLAELSAADTTLADGYGHLADRAILLHAMLKAAGFSPEFVLASSLPPIAGITNVTAALPLPQAFDYPLVRVAVDGENYYFNDTDQYAVPGSTPHDGRLAVVPATQQFETVRAAKGCENRTDTFYSLTLADSGRARIGIRRQYFGGDYNAKKQFFAELPPEERNRYFQEAVSAVAQGARPAGGLVTEFGQYPGIEEFTVELDHFAVVDGKNLYFDLPFTPSLFAAGSDRRALPLFLPGLADNTVRADIQLPPDFRRVAIAPAGARLALPADAGSATITATNAAGHFGLTYDLETSPAIVPAAAYPAALGVESALGRRSARVFLLEKGK